MTFDAERGRILPPNLDDRTWQVLVDQMRALIPRYAPGWTDHNPSDLGVTLIELFAWLTEGVVYRLNQVPDKNYVAFLNLLGITRDPPTPAHTYLTFTPSAGAVDLAAGARSPHRPRRARPGSSSRPTSRSASCRLPWTRPCRSARSPTTQARPRTPT